MGAVRHDSPLHWAAKHHNYKVAQVLVSHGADVHALDGSAGYTPLHWAALSCTSSYESPPDDSSEVQGRFTLRVLLLAGARTDVPTPQERKTPLHLIVEGQGDPKNVDVLLGSNADVLARDWQGFTARQRLQVILADKPRPDNERTSQWRTTCELLSVVENLDRRNSDLKDIELTKC